MVKYLVFAGALVTPLSAHAADFVGRSFAVSYKFPDLSTDYGGASFAPSAFTVGSGVETVGDVEGVTTIAVDFKANELVLSLSTILSNPTWNNSSFNGPVFTSFSILPFTHVALGAETNLAGFDLGRVSLSNDRISVNWGGLTYENGSKVDLIFSGGVPEPTSWIMMLGGFGMIGRAMRNRRKAIISFG